MMPYTSIREEVCRVNRELVTAGLVVLTWGNASSVDREAGILAIKPSGIDYDQLTPADIVIVDLASGDVVDGQLKPSSDTPTHRALFQAFPSIGGIVHTHSPYATSWAQARRPLPCLGTTHADSFHGEVPVARELTETEMADTYEQSSGVSIADTFRKLGLSASEMPAALLPGHAPFVWGDTPAAALEHAIALEASARMALMTLQIHPDALPLPGTLLDKHYHRKHGPRAYYGQETPS